MGKKDMKQDVEFGMGKSEKPFISFYIAYYKGKLSLKEQENCNNEILRNMLKKHEKLSIKQIMNDYDSTKL